MQVVQKCKIWRNLKAPIIFFLRNLYLTVRNRLEIWSVCPKIATFCFAYSFKLTTPLTKQLWVHIVIVIELIRAWVEETR